MKWSSSLKVVQQLLKGGGKRGASDVNPEKIIELGYAWLETATLLAGVELEIFSLLANKGGLTHLEIRHELALNERATPDFPDTLVAMNLLKRKGDGKDAVYSNTKETAVFLDKRRPTSYMGDHLMKVAVLFKKWIDHPDLIKDKSNKHQKLKEYMQTFEALASFRFMKAQHEAGDTSTISKKEQDLSPESILKVGFAFWKSRMLLTACELGLFALIEKDPSKSMPMGQIAKSLGLRKGTAVEFLDALVSSGMLVKKKNSSSSGSTMRISRPGSSHNYRDHGDHTSVSTSTMSISSGHSCAGSSAGREDRARDVQYSNTCDCAYYLDSNKEFYIGGLMEFFSSFHYAAAASMVDTLRTGDSQLAAKGTELDFYTALYPHEGAAEGLAYGLMSVMTEASVVFARTFSLQKYKTAVDIGGASGHFAARMARENPQLQVTVTDLPEMIPTTQKFIQEKWPDVQDRVKPMVHDYLKEPAFPKADVITMTMVVLQWGIDTKKMLIRKAFEALPKGGVLVVIDHFIMDDARRTDAFGLRKSLLMFLIHGNHVGGKTGDEVGGRTFTFGEYKSWCLEAGFSKVKMVSLPGQPMPAGVAYKL